MTRKNSKKLRKFLTLFCCAALLVCMTIAGTVAYLTSQDTVTNTFTVGKVAITLDEAKVGTDGKALTGEGAVRVKANSYKLMPGHVYDKDPTVTVKAGSEECYVKMTVTVSKASELDKMFKAHMNPTDSTKKFTIDDVVKGWDKTVWTLEDNIENKTDNTRTYVFYYKSTVDASASSSDIVLDDLFEQIIVPGVLTNTEINAINDTTITVNAYAVQKDGFTSADEAFTAAGL